MIPRMSSARLANDVILPSEAPTCVCQVHLSLVTVSAKRYFFAVADDVQVDPDVEGNPLPPPLSNRVGRQAAFLMVVPLFFRPSPNVPTQPDITTFSSIHIDFKHELMTPSVACRRVRSTD